MASASVQIEATEATATLAIRSANHPSLVGEHSVSLAVGELKVSLWGTLDQLAEFAAALTGLIAAERVGP